MTEADGLVVQLVITFFRNLLTIPDRAATGGLHLCPFVSKPNAGVAGVLEAT